MHKKIIIPLFCLLIFNFYAYSKDPVVNKILFKKTIIDYDQPVLINVFLNPMNAKDVIVFFNDKELQNINKNLKPYMKDDKNFLPSFSFEVKNIKKLNLLKIFVVLSQGITVSSEKKLLFEKGDVINKEYFQINKDKIFFIKVGNFYDEGTFYNLEIDNSNIIKKLGEEIRENTVYFKLKSLRSGSVKLNIFKYDESLKEQNSSPIKSIKINVNN